MYVLIFFSPPFKSNQVLITIFRYVSKPEMSEHFIREEIGLDVEQSLSITFFSKSSPLFDDNWY